MYVCELVCVCMCVCIYRYCPSCKPDSSEVISAGEKMHITKKKANMISKKHECNRDWGKVCEPGRERECSETIGEYMYFGENMVSCGL